MGESGLGKSTTTAGLVAQGYALLADDLAVLAERPAGFYVQPGLPRLMLFPDVLESVFGPSAPGLHPLGMSGKHHFSLTANGKTGAAGFHSEVLPLAAIYELAPFAPEAISTMIEPVEGVAKMIALQSHCYVAYFLDSAGRQREFAVLGRLAAAVPVRRVYRQKGLEHLPEIVKTIAADALKFCE
jgi:hypothetical protein